MCICCCSKFSFVSQLFFLFVFVICYLEMQFKNIFMCRQRRRRRRRWRLRRLGARSLQTTRRRFFPLSSLLLLLGVSRRQQTRQQGKATTTRTTRTQHGNLCALSTAYGNFCSLSISLLGPTYSLHTPLSHSPSLPLSHCLAEIYHRASTARRGLSRCRSWLRIMLPSTR